MGVSSSIMLVHLPQHCKSTESRQATSSYRSRCSLSLCELVPLIAIARNHLTHYFHCCRTHQRASIMSYSGRMPCVELADSIVQYGHEALERAVQLIESEPKWGAKVVYGDTDSLFIYLEGRTKDDAFKIGHDIDDTVSAHNPKPVKLKFEKVYLPSVLLAKKRYVGYKFEHPEDEVPTFDAKGIETVRRDGNAALQRIQEACIRILFRTRDLSQVKSFLQRQWQKILERPGKYARLHRCKGSQARHI